MIKIAIVDDSETIREGLRTLINRTEGYSCTGSFSECSVMLSEIGKLNPDVLLIDLSLPCSESIKCIKEVKLILPSLTILALTIYEENELIFEALLAGASGYLVKQKPSKKIIKGIGDALMSGTYMNSSIALKVIEYFNQKKNKTMFSEAETLTNIEQEILNKQIRGYNFKEISDALTLTIETVQINYKNIYKKLHVQSSIRQL